VADQPPLPAGLVAVTGGEQSGKTSTLRRLATEQGAQWVDLSLPGLDDHTPTQCWGALRQLSPQWNAAMHDDLVAALGLLPHADKELFMLSTGSRRKVAIAGLLACGATITCLDQPYAALDAASVQVIREFLTDMAEHPTRTWVVADYEADKRLPWAQVITLD
jgi:ABC-type multidrug transport system ATPase subunit